jgi:SAM-dependent methyltransferase
LAAAILADPACPPGVTVRGLERTTRGGEPIPVDQYDPTQPFPYEEGAFHVVLLADVLHHESDPHRLLRECVRVSRRTIIVKDHHRKGLAAQWRISLLDWAANAPYSVPCLYRYNTPDQWQDWWRTHGLKPVAEMHRMRLYPWPYEPVLGGRLHYLAVLQVPDSHD